MIHFLKISFFWFLMLQTGWSTSYLDEDLRSPIFRIQPTSSSKDYLHVRLEGEKWIAVNAEEKHQEFIVSLFRNENVMKWYGAGPSHDLDEILDRTLRLWLPRFRQGQPHGALIILDKQNQEPLGFIMGGLTDTPGIAGIAYAYAPHSWGRGIGSDVLKKFISQWAGEVKRIGLGIGIGQENQTKIMSDFQCFNGSPLRGFRAVVSPDNIPSLKILERVGFKSVSLDSHPVLDLSKIEKLPNMDWEETIRAIIALKDIEIKRGQYYKLIDGQGVERAFMIPERYDRIKYYLEYVLP